MCWLKQWVYTKWNGDVVKLISTVLFKKKIINQKNPATLAQFIEINWAKVTVPFETYK